MRPPCVFRFLFVGLVVLPSWTDRTEAGHRRVRITMNGHPVPWTEPHRDPWATQVTGTPDRSREVAEQAALIKAREELARYLRNQTPRLTRLPSDEYIEAHLVKDRQIMTVKPSENPDHAGEYQVTLNLGVTDKDYDQLVMEERRLQEEERQGRIHERMLGLGKLLAIVVAGLGAVAGYFRLEEATKGYYTTWLRIAAVGFVTAVGLMLLVVG